ncbi:PIN domain nuclease [Gracilinema caldarium]|uniref:type II toxin-antitoxin system VapC family toxin n=1 Tax=Gracilinema caldarium TaxID=215591 RepID=UPI0026EF94D0|nr:PIN domain nuclease [Gracilinema caldarium]
MILVDTSVLIDYFKGIESGPAKLFDELVEHGIPYGINTFIYQELLQGSKTIHEFNTLKEYLETIPFYDLKYGKESYEKAAFLNFQCRKNGITIRSTIDVLIAEIAIENNLLLLHNDSDFDKMSKVIKELKIYGE